MSAEAILNSIHAELVAIRQLLAVQPKAAAPAAASGPTFRFGKHSGKVFFRDDWYLNACRENVNNPNKAQYRDDNIAHLNACLASIGLPPEFTGSGGPAPDDIEF